MERHPYVVAMRAYLDGIQSTVGRATLREREVKLIYLFEVMLELRLSPDPRTMDKEEIDALVLWMRERNLGLAYQAKLWQYIRGLLAFVGNNILDVMKARGQWKPPKRAYRPVTVKDDDWFSATVARLANETGWSPCSRTKRAATIASRAGGWPGTRSSGASVSMRTTRSSGRALPRSSRTTARRSRTSAWRSGTRRWSRRNSSMPASERTMRGTRWRSSGASLRSGSSGSETKSEHAMSGFLNGT